MRQDLRDQLAAVLGAYLPMSATGERREQAIDAVLNSKTVVPIDEHTAVVKAEIDWQHTWKDKAETAEREANRLRTLIDMTQIERLQAALNLLDSAPTPSRTAQHGDGCWLRHAGCLGGRVAAVLRGER